MKRLSGGKVCSADLFNHMNVKEVEKLSTLEFANSINKASLEPLEEYRPSCLITCLALEKDPTGVPTEKHPRKVSGIISYSILLNRVALTGFRIGFFKNTSTLLPFLYAKFSMHCLKSNAYLDRGNLLM